jgi:WhiB family redox-sensing transcriptional regulator
VSDIKYRELKELLTWEPMDWANQGKCRDLQTDIFYSEGGPRSREAKLICSICPVREDCLDYAIRNLELFGVWGGHTAPERRRLRAKWEQEVLDKD